MGSPSTPAAPLLALTRRYASQTICFEIANGFGLLVGSSCPGSCPPTRSGWPVPLAPPALPGFSATTGRSATASSTSVLCPSRIGRLWVLPLTIGPTNFDHGRPASQRRGAASRVPRWRLNRAHAACTPDAAWAALQVSPKLIPRPVASSVATSLGASRRVIGGSLSSVFTGSHLTPSTGAFSATLTTPAVVPAQLAVVWSLLLIGDPGGPTPITNAAPCRVLHLHQSHLPGSRRNNCRHSALCRPSDRAISQQVVHLRYNCGPRGRNLLVAPPHPPHPARQASQGPRGHLPPETPACLPSACSTFDRHGPPACTGSMIVA